jgi:ATP-dependent Clp protease ATP-binding subunit ClpA
MGAAGNVVLTGSSDLCEELKHSRVEPCHVAYQLYIGDNEGVGSQILDKAGIEREAAETLLKGLVSALPSGQVAFGGHGVTFSQQFVDLLKRAKVEQTAAEEQLMGVDHIATAVCVQLAQVRSGRKLRCFGECPLNQYIVCRSARRVG